jgi:hypothetical protein
MIVNEDPTMKRKIAEMQELNDLLDRFLIKYNDDKKDGAKK